KCEVLNGIGGVYEGLDSRLNLNRIFEERVKQDKNFIVEHEAEGRRRFTELIKISEKIGKADLRAGNNKLSEYLQEYKKVFYRYTPFLFTVFSAESLLTRELKDQIAEGFSSKNDEEKENIFRILTAVEEESDFYNEQKDLLGIAVAGQRGLLIDSELKNHAERFGYMGLTNSFLSNPYTTDHFAGLIKEIKKPGEELQELETKREKEIEKYKEFVKSIPSQILRTAELLQRYMIFRNDRITALKVGQHNIKPLLKEIGDLANITLEDLYWYKIQEIEGLIKGSKKPVNVDKRRKYIEVILTDGVVTYNETLPRRVKEEKVKQLTGYAASKGLVTGQVKLCFSSKDIDKVKAGDILVTSMTTPDFVPAMRIAGAIITDEGGILSHAAIVSREFGVPCIIGTGNATALLKDGDVVEVDANNGIVRLIERA
ncbi:MAG: PEP-utilizing enzyme, partial [Patescibacteria group bacterium]